MTYMTTNTYATNYWWQQYQYNTAYTTNTTAVAWNYRTGDIAYGDVWKPVQKFVSKRQGTIITCTVEELRAFLDA